MKRLFFVLIALLFSASAFTAQFVISPTLGYDNFFTTRGYHYDGLLERDENESTTANAFAVGLTIGTITKNGFTFYWDNSFVFNPGINVATTIVQTNSLSTIKYKTKSFFYHTELLFGYTFRLLANKLHIGIALGIDGGLGGGKVTEVTVNDSTTQNKNANLVSGAEFLGGCIHVNVDYFFTKQIGITLSLTDAVNFGGLGVWERESGEQKSDSRVPFNNTFSLRVGPKFIF